MIIAKVVHELCDAVKDVAAGIVWAVRATDLFGVRNRCLPKSI